MNARLLSASTWPEVGDVPIVLVPIGSLEQHGPHLPLDTDTVIASAVCERVLADLPGAWLAPALAFGSSGEHQAFSGTVSIGTDVLRTVIVELVRSIATWAEQIVLVNGHGGNVEALSTAVAQLRSEGHRVCWLACETETVDLHAGFTETSLMLHLAPGTVRLERAEAGNTAPLRSILPAMRSGGVAAVSSNGVLGDPAGATAEEGAHVLASMASSIADTVRALVAEPVGQP